jgi:hypothetical protein
MIKKALTGLGEKLPYKAQAKGSFSCSKVIGCGSIDAGHR